MLGKRYLRKLRKINNLTMRKLAEKCNISQSYISDLENEKIKKPSIDTIYKIADALEVSVFDLVGEQYKNATEDFSEDGVFFLLANQMRTIK